MSRTWLTSVALAIPMTLVGLYTVGVALGMAGGATWKIGYYGKFNRVRSLIEQMPDVHIVDTWQHEDVTLEDFGFTVSDASNRTAKIDFMRTPFKMKLAIILMPKIERGRLSGFDGMAAHTAGKLYAWADRLEAQMTDPLTRDDPKWLQRWAEKMRSLAAKKEKAKEHKSRCDPNGTKIRMI